MHSLWCVPIRVFELLGGISLNGGGCLLLFMNMSLKYEHESDGVSTWAKLDCCTYNQYAFTRKSTVKGFVVVYM